MQPCSVCAREVLIIVVKMLFCFAIASVMAAAASSSNEPTNVNAVLASMHASGRTTKTATVQTLLQLQNAGLLNSEEDEQSLKRKMQTAVEEHSKATTDYGPLVQKIKIGDSKLEDWEVCHPCAFLAYMSSISATFCDVLKGCMANGRPLRLVIYGDEMIPGNPFRPEKARKLMCLYWTFVDFPAWMLTRSFAWPCFSILRSVVMDKLDGGFSYLARIILHYFFPATGDSLERGIVLKDTSGEAFVVKAIFAGWLCDLAGHKEMTSWKGWGGNVCCLECPKLDRRHRGPVTANGVFGIDCCDNSRFVQDDNTNPVWDAVDAIAAAAAAGIMKRTPFGKLETDRGFNHVPNGILLDMPLRRIYWPNKHTIRDWQHTLCSDGVGNTLIRQVLLLIEPRGTTVDHMKTFMSICHLPKKYGTVQPQEWLGPNRLQANTIKSFSSVILNLVPLVFLFLEHFLGDDPAYADVLRMHYLFHIILGVLSTGPEEAPKHKDKLRLLIVEFHKIFARLSTSLKPKLHHFHHIIDGIEWLGKSLSCFVTERKHRIVKDSALYVFRHLEHTVLADIVNKQCHQFSTGVDLFKEQFLHMPRDVRGVPGFRQSTSAILRCGLLGKGDIVWFQNASCGRVIMFYEVGDWMFVHAEIFENINDEPSRLDENRSSKNFLDSRSVVDACAWFSPNPGEIKIAIPPIVLM